MATISFQAVFFENAIKEAKPANFIIQSFVLGLILDEIMKTGPELLHHPHYMQQLLEMVWATKKQ